MNASRQLPPPRERGVALVITLTMLVLITIIVVGLVGALRVERGAAASHAERARAFELAKMGENEVVAKLQKYTGDKDRVWISQPGQLVAGTDSDKKTLAEAAPLSSGQAAGDPAAPSLNAATFLDPGSRLITDRPADGDGAAVPPMRLQWIYVRQDGAIDRGGTAPPPDPNNPVVGRYAYWTDDESSKVNYNTAWGRTGNTTHPGHPSRIELAALDGFDQDLADQLRAGPAGNRFFNSPLDARLLGGALAAALAGNKFDVTHYNHDPDTTFFNGKRIVLTTKRARAYDDTHYLKILKGDESGDPGNIDNIDANKLKDTLGMLIGEDYLANDELPIAPGSSFQKKYYNGNEERLTQMALNIIEYVRSRESPMAVVEPIRGAGAGASFSLGSATGSNAYMGVARTPLITELGAFQNGPTGTIKAEICVPKNWGIKNEPLSNYSMYFYWNGAPFTPSTGLILGMGGASAAAGGPTHIGKDGVDDYVPLKFSIPYALPNPVELRVAIVKGGGGGKRLDVVPLVSDQFVSVARAAKEEDVVSREVDDPRANKHSGDWKTCLTGSTFGSVNSRSSVGKTPGPSGGPQVDTDKSGLVSDASLYMPPPASAGNNAVSSIGELGYIHTGLESSKFPGTPWRTIRLQTSKEGPDVIPDWVFLDFFTVPAGQASQAVLAPHGSTIGGRININSKVEPFGMERLVPLKAALVNAQKTNSGQRISSGEAGEIAGNIYDRTLGSDGDAYGYPGAYDAIGEICEVARIGDEGEEGEALIRDLANLLTTRGDVFTVYSIGQALKQTPDGRLLVTAEQRQQTMIERYPIEDENREVVAIGFNTVYFRNLAP